MTLRDCGFGGVRSLVDSVALIVHRPKPAQLTLSKVTFHSPVDNPHCSCLGGLTFEEHHSFCLPVQFWAVSAKRWSFSPCRVLRARVVMATANDAVMDHAYTFVVVSV